MFFIVIVVVAVAVGALLRQQQSKQHRPAANGENANAESAEPLDTAAAKVKDNVQISEHDGLKLDGDGRDTSDSDGSTSIPISGAGGLPQLQSQDESFTPVLSAKPISSPDALAGATYSSSAPASSGSDSPYGYGNKDPEKKAKPAKNLLRWCGRTGSLQVDSFLLLGPITYWSEGQSAIQEPSCIDLSMPVEYPTKNVAPTGEIPGAYADMTPLQRGLYLTWLAGGRIQPPIHACYPTLWLYGLERRVIADRLDLGLCFSEAFRLLPLIRWEPLLENLVKFITWLAIKIWMPEDELLAFCKRLQTVPESLLGLLLGPYANAKLALPAGTAFTLMRTSAKLREAALAPLGPNLPAEIKTQRMVHSDELQQIFAPMYRNACNGGLKLKKPGAVTRLKYVPMNPALSGSNAQNKAKSEVAEIPDFFDDLEPFEPLFAVWRDFVKSLVPSKPKPTAAEEIESRPDFAGFIEKLEKDRSSGTQDNAAEFALDSETPMASTLADLAALMNLEMTDEKLHGRDRKEIVEMTRVEGYQVLPNLGMSGRDYFWTDPILFLHLDLGAKLSNDYNTASFLLEFCCALLELQNARLFEPLRQRLNDYFLLTREDNLRLDAQSLINLPAPHPKEFYGDFLQFMLQEPDRCTLRNFLLNLLDFIPESQLTKATLTERVCTVLSVAPDAPPQMGEDPASKRGQTVAKIFSGLFKDV